MQKYIKTILSIFLFTILAISGCDSYKDKGEEFGILDFLSKPSGSLYLSSPRSGQIDGGVIEIKWYADTIKVKKVSLYYSSNEGTNWTSIASNITASVRKFKWTVPTYITSVKIKIKDDSSNVESISEQITISPKVLPIVITSPVGGEQWEGGTTQNILWSRNNFYDYVKVEYSTDGGSVWNVITSSTNFSYYSWSVPTNVSSNNCYIRITSNSDNSKTATSNRFEIIKPKAISITTPSLGTSWLAGSSQTIYWTKNSSSFSYVKIDYSTNNGKNWSNITTSASASSGYTWSIPSTISSDSCKIKVSSTTTTDYDISQLFTVKPASFSLSYPKGGEALTANSAITISWSKIGISGYSYLYYSVDNGSTWTYITSVSSSYSQYSWTVPDVNTSQLKIMVSNSSTATTVGAITNVSGSISITGGSTFTFTAPTSSSIWTGGTTQNVTWNCTGNVLSTYIYIQYSSDGGTQWYTAVSSTYAGNKTASWTIPSIETTSTNFKLRATNNTSGTIVYAVSPTFTVKPAGAYTVTYPVGGEKLSPGNNISIQWSQRAGTTQNYAKIDYTTNAGKNWTNIISSIASTAGSNRSFSWSIPTSPAISSDSCLIRVSDPNDATNYDVSDNYFSIKPISVKLTYPNGGESLVGGNTATIVWDYTGAPTSNTCSLYYSTNNGTDWTLIYGSVSISNKSYSWTVPDISTSQAKIKIDFGNGITDISDNAFSISGSSISVTAPTSSTVWQAGQTATINWNYTGTLTYVNLYYSTDNGTNWTSIAQAIQASTKTYSWNIPAEFYAPSCKIKVANYYNTALFGVSPTFQIQGPTLTLTNPTNTSSWIMGSTYDISWTMSGSVPYVNLYYSTDNGTNWTAIVNGMAGSTLKYSWTVPTSLTASSTMKIKIASYNYPDMINNISPAFSIVKPKITLTAPTSGTTWNINTTQQITWDYTGSLSYVNLYYSTNSGTNWTLLAQAVSAATKSYSWSVPSSFTSGSTYKIKVEDYYSYASPAISNAFTISAAYIAISAPTTNVQWKVGTTQNITWSSADINYVNIQYSVDSAKTWLNIATNVVSSGKYVWTIPDNVSTACFVRIVDASNTNLKSLSGQFTIFKPTVTFIRPTSGESFLGNTTQNIKWTSTNLTYVNIYYSSDNGTTWNTVQTAVASNSGSTNQYSWSVPVLSATSTTSKIKIQDYYDNTVSFISPTFTIAKQ